MSDTNTTEQEGRQFKRELGIFDATMLVIGSMIGSGIFIVSADIAQTVGSSGYLLLVWGITGIMTMIAALSFGELASMMPKAGGQYVYLREAYNPLVGFLYGWTLFTVIQTGTIAAVAVAFAKFLSALFPVLGRENVLFSIVGLKVSASQITAIFSICVLTAINYRGIRDGKILQNIFTVFKIVALGSLIVLGIAFAANSEVIFLNFNNMWKAVQSGTTYDGTRILRELTGLPLVAAIGAAMVGSLFSSDAWNNITFTAGEVKKPQRTIPLSLFWGTLAVTLLYILVNFAYLCLLPVMGDASSADVYQQGIPFAPEGRVGISAAQMIFGPAGAVIMAVILMISTFGCNNGLILAGARVYYSMSQDKLFFKSASHLNKYSVPGKALIFQAIWASGLCLSGTYANLLDYVVFAVLIFYILTIGGIFILRRRQPNAERPYKAIGYPVLPALYIAAASVLCLILLLFKPQFTWPGLIIVLLGIPVYLFAIRDKEEKEE